MIEAVILGLGAAACLGSSDFLARFTSLRLGARCSLHLRRDDRLNSDDGLRRAVRCRNLSFSAHGLILSTLHGASVVAMSVMLYAALARGPISLAVPIVAAHPVLVLLYELAAGTSKLSLQQGFAAALVISGASSPPAC